MGIQNESTSSYSVLADNCKDSILIFMMKNVHVYLDTNIPVHKTKDAFESMRLIEPNKIPVLNYFIPSK